MIEQLYIVEDVFNALDSIAWDKVQLAAQAILDNIPQDELTEVGQEELVQIEFILKMAQYMQSQGSFTFEELPAVLDSSTVSLEG